MPTSTSHRRARQASYVPLCITAALRCGVISDGLLPIDAMLYYALHRDTRPGERWLALPRQSARIAEPEDVPLVLPIKRLDGSTREWYYAASCARWPSEMADGTDYWTKRTDSRYADLVTTRARVPISGGRYRAYRMPVSYRHALTVSWCVVGEPTEIRRLLQLVTHLGKKTEMGWGAVASWTVATSDDDWSVRDASGRLTRPVPDADGGVLYGFRPPYWHPRNQTPCRLPEEHGQESSESAS